MSITIARAGFSFCHDSARGVLAITSGGHTLTLAVQGAVNRPDRIDTGTAWELASRSAHADGDRLTFRAIRATQGIWDTKLLIVDVGADDIHVRLRIQGHGAIDRVTFGAGFAESVVDEPAATMRYLTWARRPWSRSWTGSPLSHRQVMNPQPNSYGEQVCDSALPQRVTCATTFGPELFNTFFAPPLYAYVFDDAWCLGIVAAPGQNRFTHLDYTIGSGWGLELHYDGMTSVAGDWESPALRIAPCENAEAGLVDYVAHLSASGCVPRVGNRTPDWCRRPMLCGWGQQVAWAHLHEHGNQMPLGSPITSGAGGYASQSAYEAIVELADRHDLPFGVLTIDMGWSEAMTMPRVDPRMWPDLAGFIATQHARGRKVLLWLATWNPGGLDETLRMPHAEGLKDACDPTNPEFRRRLSEAVAHCVSPDGLNADGFKLDFTGDIVRGAGYRPAVPGPWGMELLKDYVGLIHASMHAAKADTVLETHCANPYFADVTDYLRLNDIFSTKVDVSPMMEFRARMARIANPRWALDTDNDPFMDRAGWLDYMRFQPRIGVPSLYSLTHLSTPGADGTLAEIRAADLAEISAIWHAYGGGP